MRKLNVDLKALANSALAKDLTRHLNQYEARVKEVVRDFDLKSRARGSGIIQRHGVETLWTDNV